jgi:lysophospholipase L1-like esterase
VAIALAVLAVSVCLGIVRPAEAAASTAAERQAVAQWWAPVHFQDVDTSGETSEGGKSDYLAAYDFDGDQNGRNNWENITESPLAANVYSSVVETEGYWYLLYTFFHPRDWADAALDNPQEDITEHENDAEGVLVVVERDGSEHGALKAAITVSHSHFYSYVPDGGTWTSEGLDGTLPLMSSPHTDGHQRPWTAQQAGTHAAWAATDLSSLREEYAYGDGILYYPGSTAEVPEGSNDRDVQYALTDVFAPGGMWDSRNLTSLFATPDNFAGDDGGNPNGAACGEGGVAGPADGECGTDSANPPWAWDDQDDTPGRGYIATNPAELVFQYFNWKGKPASPDLDYTWNPYNGITPPDPDDPPESSPMGRVLVVGDSISNGFEGDYTWRYRLWQWTRNQNVPATFVGPLTGTSKPEDPHPPVPPPLEGSEEPAESEPDPDRFTGAYAQDADDGFVNGGSAHYAMWGRQLGQDVHTIKSVMDDLKSEDQLPDLLLVELGFNDIGWLGAGAGLVDTMKDFVDQARAANPDVAIVLANVPHRTTLGAANPQLPRRTTDYNAALAEAIPTWDTDDSPVVLADLDEALDCDPTAKTCATTYDGLHPNALGEYRIAQAFGTALHEEFDIGSAAPEVPDTMPTRQVGTPTDLEFDGTQQGVTVTWPKVFGVHRYEVQWRDVTADADADWQEAVPGAPTNRWDLSWQFNDQPHDGHTYEVRVRAITGDSDDLRSPWSAPVRGVAHPTTAPPPATLHAAAGAGSVDVAWTAPTGPHTDSITRYALWIYDEDTPQVHSRVIGYPASARTAHVDGLAPGHHYRVFMCTWNASGESKPRIAAGTVIPR